MTFEQIRAFIYELKMDVAYNRKDFDMLEKIHDRANPMLDRLNQEIGTGYWHYSSEPYKKLLGFKYDLCQIQRNCDDLRLRIYYGNDSIERV